MKIDAYIDMMNDLRAENENLKERTDKQFDKLQSLTEENADLKNQLLRLQKTSAEVAHQNKTILADSKEIQANFVELRKIYNKLYKKYTDVKKCYDNLVDFETIHVKARDFYTYYNVKENKYYLFLNFENETQTQIEITKDVYDRIF